MNNWISIEKEQPMEGESVLVYMVEDEPRIELAKYRGVDDWYINEDYINSNIHLHVKFWMRLPMMPYSTPEELKAIKILKYIAENPCVCDMGCPSCDAKETLEDMGIKL